VPHSQNRLLASLPADVFAALAPHLKMVELTLGDVVAEDGGIAKRRPYQHYNLGHCCLQIRIKGPELGQHQPLLYES